MSEVIVHPRDLPPAGLCVSGARDWFAAYGRPDLFKEFIKHGLPVSVFRSFNDALAERACVSAEQRAAREQS